MIPALRILKAATVGTALAAASACDVTNACTLIDMASFSVSVVDSTSGNPAAAGRLVALTSPTFRDSVLVPLSDTSAFATAWSESDAGAGRYTLRVSKAGYRDWVADNLIIRPGGCHIANTQVVTARLQH